MVSNHKYEPILDIDIDVQGYIQAAWAWVLQSPDLTLWDIRVDAITETLKASTIASGFITSFKVTKPDTSEASFSIDNSGILTVTSPPPGGELLINTLYILGTDSTVWHVTVNNSNILEITKIFPV